MADDMTTAVAQDLGIADLPDAAQKKLVAQFGEVALKAATVAVLEKLSKEKREAFMQLTASGAPEQIKAFLDAEVPDHEALAKAAVRAEVASFRAAQGS